MGLPSDETSTIGPIPASLPSRPLDFIAADHVRERRLCEALDRIAETRTADPTVIDEILAHVRDDLGRHIEDEEQDLFPLLRRRCAPEDDIDLILGRLDREHTKGKSAIARLVDDLTRLAEPGATVDDAIAGRLRSFAHDCRQHLAIENGAILPLARVRLTAADLADLGKRMAARRRDR